MTRKKANIRILIKLMEEVMRHPDWRFGQLLYNVEAVSQSTDVGAWKDEHFLESEDLLKRIKCPECD